MASPLSCPACGAEYAPGPDEPWRCSCGAPLELAADPPPNSPQGRTVDPGEGLWTFEEWLPVRRRVSLGEGFTPLVSAGERWGEAVGFKLEYVFPTGSFKDRGATTTLSRAAELGVKRVIEDSSGNAGAAIATYAARAGIDAEIYVPAGVKASKLSAIERAGARPVRVEGGRAAVTEACLEAVERGEGWYASHAWNPAFYAGTSTFAFEIAAQRGWSVPDAVVCPVGHGTLLLGAYRGFRALYNAGITDRLPRLLGVQSEAAAPIAEAIGGDERDQSADATTVADGIRIEAPARHAEIVEAVEVTNGDAIALDDGRIEAALDRLHRGGFYVEPTSAVAPAAVERYRELGVVEPGADVVVPLTGSGLKGE
ncbi:pyridoxal-phosphate dependent enzyme [Saliphagus sp. LR7]|uniref:pyridoxal-phosphate dependent enzyme n=1 Tax=Saliphagus sp. LR7 TaxID=2282654 RepID=UPI000DF740E9|nr:pyridoxal-phosphate dependent enzyme [Saliphagus sp. LR7]